MPTSKKTLNRIPEEFQQNFVTFSGTIVEGPKETLRMHFSNACDVIEKWSKEEADSKESRQQVLPYAEFQKLLRISQHFRGTIDFWPMMICVSLCQSPDYHGNGMEVLSHIFDMYYYAKEETPFEELNKIILQACG